MKSTPPEDEVEYVAPHIIQELFNQSEYARMIAEGGLRSEDVRKPRHLKEPEKKGEPECTHSQMIRYYDKGRWVVEIHQYLRKDNTIGGSGKPDPKRLRLGTKVFAVPPSTPSSDGTL